MIRLVYDAISDSAEIYLKKGNLAFGELAETHLCSVELKDAAVILGFDAKRRLIKIEILGARNVLPLEALETIDE